MENVPACTSVLVLELAHGTFAFKCVLIPAGTEAKAFISKLPQDKLLEVVFEVKSKNVEFRGTAKFSNFNESGKRPILFLNSINGNFLLVFDIALLKRFRKKAINITELENERFELAFEKPWF